MKASSTATRRCRARQNSKCKSIKFNDYRSIGIFWRDNTSEQARVLEMKPGITGAASIVYSNEEAELAKHADCEQYYREVVMPRKLRLDLSYGRNMSLMKDLELVVKTALKVIRVAA